MLPTHVVNPSRAHMLVTAKLTDSNPHALKPLTQACVKASLGQQLSWTSDSHRLYTSALDAHWPVQAPASSLLRLALPHGECAP